MATPLLCIVVVFTSTAAAALHPDAAAAAAADNINLYPDRYRFGPIRAVLCISISVFYLVCTMYNIIDLFSDRFPFFVRTDFLVFGPISICSDRFPFVRTDFHLFGSISIICSD
jgi:hypothetical protein